MNEFGNFGVADEIDNLKKKISKSRLFILLSALTVFFVFISVRSTIETLSGLMTILLRTNFALIAYSITIVLKTGLLSLFVPAISLLTVLVQTRDLSIILITLSFIPAGLALGISVKAKKTRLQSVLYGGFITSTIIFIILGYQLYLYKGAITYDTYYETVMDIASAYVKRYLLPLKNFNELFKEISPIDMASDTIKRFLAAFVLIIGFSQAYFSGYVLKNFIKRLGLEDEYFSYDKKWELLMSKISTVVFLLSSILFTTFHNFYNVGLIAPIITVMYPLGAGFAIIGVKSFFTFLKRSKMLPYIIISLLLFGQSLFSLLIVLLVFIGLLKTLLRGTKLDIFQKSE